MEWNVAMQGVYSGVYYNIGVRSGSDKMATILGAINVNRPRNTIQYV